MATWKSENSILTQRGVEILNKLKAGNGSITITRVVAGSGRVSESSLYTQTSVSGVQKEMTIHHVNTTESGSEISVQISNENFTESYSLQQIGIYVTHKDYDGEQLYHISQCDAESIDSIPKFNLTPVTQGYSIFMEHDNSSSVNFTFNTQGMVSRPELESEVARLETAIEDKVTGSCYNILHNWYLKDPINQRGQTEYADGEDYLVDRWKRTYGLGKAKVTNEGLNLSMKNEIDAFTVVQILGKKSDFVGKWLTLSAIIDGKLVSETGIVADEHQYTIVKYFDGGYISVVSGAYIDSTTQMLVSEIVCQSTTGIKVSAIKLELGTKQTLASVDREGNITLLDFPPEKGMELLRCVQTTVDPNDPYTNHIVYHSGNYGTLPATVEE